jgi:hypothetical protein
MSIHPYIFCGTCQVTQPVFYDFESREWICFVCRHAVSKPEDNLKKPGKLQGGYRRNKI